LQLGALRDAGLCAAPPKAERLSYDVTRRLQLVSQPLSVAPGARLDFIAQLKNISQRPVVVEIQVGSGFSSVSSHSLTQAGSPVLVGKCNVSYLTSSEWYRVEIPAGASLGLDGRFFANIARVSAEDAPCPPPPLTRGSYELKVSVTVNGQELSGQAELRVR